MKKNIILVVMFVVSSCAPLTPVSEPAIAVANTATLLATETQVPIPTFTPTLTPTPTISPDLNTYECAENVSQEDCDFVKNGVRLARYYFVNNFGRDVSRGVKFVIINNPKDISFGEGGSAGAHQVTKQGESFIWINVGLQVWTEFSTPEFQYKNLGLIVHEFTHEWQWQLGCNKDSLKGPKQPTSFLIEGYAGYVGRIASGVDLSDYLFSDALALSFWQASQWDEAKWFSNEDVNLVPVKHLVEAYGLKAYTQFCNAIGNGVLPNDAFQSAYGISIVDFRAKFKEQVLGDLKDCTVATCGAGVDNFSDKYQLGHLIDPTLSSPNLIMHFVDENNLPIGLTHFAFSRWRPDGNGDDVQPFKTTEIFSAALLPGRYIFSFCEPGYPTNLHPFSCQMHETDWINVYSDQVTNVTLQIPPAIDKPSLAAPDLVVKFSDKDGNPLANLGIQICNYDTQVKICSSIFPKIRKSDANGVYQDTLRSGKYFIRVPLEAGNFGKYDFVPIYLIKNISIDETSVTTVDYQFPTPNLVVKFTDANGSPVSNHEFILCKLVQGVGDCSSPVIPFLFSYAHTNRQGIFEAQIEPGEYYILTCKLPSCPPPYEIKITNIIVVNETQVTTVEYSLYK